MSTAVALVAASVVATIGSAAVSLSNKPKMPAPLKQQTRNDAAEAAGKRDVLSRRRGVAANMLLGSSGAESQAGGKSALGA